MSIIRDGSMYKLICDICGEESSNRCFNFADAVEVKKQEGWRSGRDSEDEWQDICPACQR